MNCVDDFNRPVAVVRNPLDDGLVAAADLRGRHQAIAAPRLKIPSIYTASEVVPGMWQVGSATPARSRVRLFVLALIPALLFVLSACGSDPAPPPVKVIADKGTPFGDLLIPQLAASVKDGAVDVAVDKPVTITATGGVLGSVTMVNESGTEVAGQLSPDGVTWKTTEPLGYNKSYTLSARSLGLGGVTTEKLTFETQSPENLTMPYLLPGDGEVVGVGQPIAVRFD